MMKINITNMQKEIEYLEDRDGITGISCEGIGGGSGNNSLTERTALRNVEETEELKQKIDKAQLELDSIDRALDGLTETERAIVSDKYLNGLQWWQVAYSVGYSERHCKRLRTEAVEKLVLGVYGDEAI